MPNFSLSGPLISFWQRKPLLMGVAKTKSHLLPHLHPRLVNSAHPVTWRIHTNFLPDSLVL